jgi:hypothetical protein
LNLLGADADGCGIEPNSIPAFHIGEAVRVVRSAD